MRIVSVINYKGGVGKTTLTANLGAELALRGQRVLLIDLDPQASLTFSFITPEVWQRDFAAERTIKTWFERHPTPQRMPLSELIFAPERMNAVPHLAASGGRLSLVPSHLTLLNVDLELAAGLAGGTLAQIRRNYLDIHGRLARGLAGLPADAYDLVLIDCPPSFNVVTRTAIAASDALLVPARPDYLSTLGINYLVDEVERLRVEYNGNAAQEGQAPIAPALLGVVFTMVGEWGGRPQADHREYMSRVERIGQPVFASYMKHNHALFAGAPEALIPVVVRAFGSARRDAVVVGLEAIADEFLQRLPPERIA